MMLVLVCMLMATILAAAFLASRDNSAVVGLNANRQTEARWIAQAGLETGVALLETSADWRTAHTDGILLDSKSFGAGTFTVELIDLETRLPPTEETTDVGMTVDAVIEGVQQTCNAILEVPLPEADKTVDVDLSEFAVFSKDTVELADDALITRWPNAPKTAEGDPIAIATNGTGANTIVFNDRSVVVDTTVHHSPGASTALLGGTSPTSVALKEVGGVIPMPAPAPPTISNAGVAPGGSNLNVSGVTGITNSQALLSVDVESGAALEISGNAVILVEGSFRLASNALAQIDGDVEMIVLGSLILEPGAALELTEGSTLSMHVFGSVGLNNAYVGHSTDLTRDNSGMVDYVNPEALQLFSMSSYTDSKSQEIPAGAQSYQLTNSSVFVGTMYAPNAALAMTGESAVYGRVAVDNVAMVHESSIFYDPALDLGYGYRSDAGMMYEEDGSIKADVMAVAELTEAELADLAADLGGKVRSAGKEVGTVDAVVEEFVGVNESTSRPVPVEVSQISFGPSPWTWETHAEVVLADGGEPETIESAGESAEASMKTPSTKGVIEAHTP